MISLKKLCLNLIIQEFERFQYASEVSNDENLKRNFEFLQRKYSCELASELFKKGILKEKYLEFIMNEHLKFLEETWLEQSCYRKSMKNIFCRLPNLTEITCFETSDEILENVAKYCPKLVEINAHCSSVTDEGIKYLCKNEKGEVPCPQLKKLYIDSDSVTDEGLTCLILDLPSIEEIDHKNVPVILYFLHKDDLPSLENLHSYNITYLNFSTVRDLPYYTDIIKICLKVCPRLKSMKCHIADNAELNLFNSVKLENLKLNFLEVNPQIDIDNFLKMNGCNLVSLEVNFNCIMINCKISINVLTVCCPKLRRLDLSKITFSEDHDGPQAIFNFLTECAFNYVMFDRSIKAMNLFLSSSPNLKQLTFYYCKLYSETENYNLKFCENNVLKKVSFFNCYVDMNIVKDILLNSAILDTLMLQACAYYDLDERMELTEFAETLSNKPDIFVNGYLINNYNYEYQDIYRNYEDHS